MLTKLNLSQEEKLMSLQQKFDQLSSVVAQHDEQVTCLIVQQSCFAAKYDEQVTVPGAMFVQLSFFCIKQKID